MVADFPVISTMDGSLGQELVFHLKCWTNRHECCSQGNITLMFFLFFPKQNLLTMEQIVTVEETQVKDKKCILLRIKGGKQFVLQCEVGGRSVPSMLKLQEPER